MDLKGKKLILSSASPRRKELLEGLGLDFTIDTGTSFIEQYAPDAPGADSGIDGGGQVGRIPQAIG